LITVSFSLYKPAPQPGTYNMLRGLLYKYLPIPECVAGDDTVFKMPKFVGIFMNTDSCRRWFASLPPRYSSNRLIFMVQTCDWVFPSTGLK
jgi:hypothetical protein